RERPSSFDIAASTRWPSSPSGTRMERSVMRVLFHTGGVRSVDVDASEADDHERDYGGGDRDVRDVADEQRQIDEVDDGSVQECGFAEEPVDEVAEESAQEQTESDRPCTRAELAGDHEDRDEDADGHDREDPRHARAEAQRSSGIAVE